MKNLIESLVFIQSSLGDLPELLEPPTPQDVLDTFEGVLVHRRHPRGLPPLVEEHEVRAEAGHLLHR